MNDLNSHLDYLSTIVQNLRNYSYNYTYRSTPNINLENNLLG